MREMPLTMVEIAAVADLPKCLRDVVPIAEMAAQAAKELAVERGLRETAERMCKRMQDERNATYDAHALGKLADELDEDNNASAAKALREAIFMLDRAAKERAAWIRWARAEPLDLAEYNAERESARAEFQALGVDVDALLAE